MTPGFMRGLPGEGSLLSRQFGPGTRWARHGDEAGRTSTAGKSMSHVSFRGWDGWLLREGVTEVWRRRSSFVVVPHESGKVRMVAKRSGRRLC